MRVGRFVATPHPRSGSSVFVDHGPRVGAFVGLRWRVGQARVEVSLAPRLSDPRSRQWASLFAGLVAGVAIVAAFRPYRNAKLAVIGALLGGAVLGRVALVGAGRSGLGMNCERAPRWPNGWSRR